jgi:nicotinamidase-related amidase
VKASRSGSGDAVLVIDVLSDYRFEGGKELLARLRPRIPALARLLRRARTAGVPVVYANDNLGRWRSSLEDLGENIRAANPEAWRSLEPLHPAGRDHVVLKPRHSAFYCTPLELLLEALDVGRLVLTGVSATSCIWFTAADAHLRGYEVVVPSDGIAARSPRLTRAVLDLLQDSLHAATPATRDLRLRRPRRAQRAAG